MAASAKDQQPSSSSPCFFNLCYLLFALSLLSSFSFIYWSHSSSSPPCTAEQQPPPPPPPPPIDLLTFPSAWNTLSFSPLQPPRHLKIALFVKRWPQPNLAGGLERHALTLHHALAARGHEVHVFAPNSSLHAAAPPPPPRIHLHPTRPSPAGNLDQASAWSEFMAANSSGADRRPFDVVHTESVSLSHGRARNITNLAVSWHGIAYEAIHSDIVQDLLRRPNETRQPVLSQKLARVADEVRFFGDYSHHVATSNHVGDVLKRVYMIPDERVHIIINGVDGGVFRPDPARRREFRRSAGLPEDAKLVIGVAGRLVKDKGHPLMVEALRRAFGVAGDGKGGDFRKGVYVLVAGDGPWGSRYRELGPSVVVLGPLEQDRLAMFYDGIDVFVNPTMRAQGLDHTTIEAMISGVAVATTRFASITGSLVVSPEVGYTFSPTAESLRQALLSIFRDGGGGGEVLRKKGEAAREMAARLFTAEKMAAAYERLFLCIARDAGEDGSGGDNYCKYPLPWET